MPAAMTLTGKETITATESTSVTTVTTATTTTKTRVCIKNLPPKFDETKLQLFLLKESKIPLHITDIKILRRTDGTSRKLAFLGFSTPEQASHVVQHFDKSYCMTCRLAVELAISKQAPEKPRPWSKHSKGSTEYEKKHGIIKDNVHDTKNKVGGNAPPESNMKPVDKRKEEFLAAMGVGKEKTKFWANDDAVALPAEKVAVDSKADTAVPKDDDQDSEDRADGDDDDDDDESSVASDDSGGQGADIMKVSEPKKLTLGSIQTDLDFLRSKATIKVELESDDEDDEASDTKTDGKDDKLEEEKIENDDTDSSCSSSDDSSNDDEPKDATLKGESAQPPASNEPIVSSDAAKNTDEDADDEEFSKYRLFVRNLPFLTTEDDLRELFIPYGNIEECRIPVDDQKRNKGFAFITFSHADSTGRAMDTINGTDFQGRLLHVLPARRSNAADDLSPDDPSLTYKQRQELLRKSQAASSQGWSASFVRGDAVVDNLADRLGLRKGDILNVKDGRSGDAAVRLALGETQIIEENRQYFEAHRIDMEALVSISKGDDEYKRSSTSILVKNLPFETEKDELVKLFGDTPRRILLPPSRTIALVEYDHPVDAKRAFKKLAYKRFKSVPLYLEWAPLSATVPNPANDKDSDHVNKVHNSRNEEEGESMAVDDQIDTGTSSSIYVKNLSFSTTEEQLRALFEKHVPVRAVKIPVKAAPLKRSATADDTTAPSTRMLSMGFGFVECDSEESVRKALRALQGTVVDDHALELKRSSKSLTRDDSGSIPKVPKGKNPTKIMCRNVPFQATRKEILQLFGSFGQLKKVRLPKKFDGQHRGFAFVEFLTSQEAQSAMTALSRTHLYGRHLVLEWASDNEEIDILREKAKRDIEPTSKAKDIPKNKKIKFSD
ncbi:RNA recognition motif containing protein [Fragilaria crotonensis]|nr:RNA recognition motif containing protein [Fragilaria crotonensis]